jgi:hypothetical protein
MTHDARVVEKLSVYDDASRYFEAQGLERAEALLSRLSEDPVSRAPPSRIRGYMQSGGIFTHIWNLTAK